jgi:hypothetical protein
MILMYGRSIGSRQHRSNCRTGGGLFRLCHAAYWVCAAAIVSSNAVQEKVCGGFSAYLSHDIVYEIMLIQGAIAFSHPYLQHGIYKPDQLTSYALQLGAW